MYRIFIACGRLRQIVANNARSVWAKLIQCARTVPKFIQCKILQRGYLSKLRRDSVGVDFQSVRKLTNYVCAKPPESRLSVFFNIYKDSSDIYIKKIADIKIT